MFAYLARANVTSSIADSPMGLTRESVKTVFWLASSVMLLMLANITAIQAKTNKSDDSGTSLSTSNSVKHFDGSYKNNYRARSKRPRYYPSSWRWGGHWHSDWRPGLSIGWSHGYYNPWGWGNRWHAGFSPYRYEYFAPNRIPATYSQPLIAPKSEISAQSVTRTATYYSVDTGLKRLPTNAQVLQIDGRTYYIWQGVTYQFDWHSMRYYVVEPE